MTIVFAALYWDGPESAAGVISLHLTREGAEKAVAQHKERERQSWLEVCEATDTKFDWSDEHGNGFSGWLVEAYEVQL